MKIGVAWKRVDSNGDDYISCRVKLPFIDKKIDFKLFPADKKGEKSPDFDIIVRD